ncbi:OS-9-like protein [Trichonephila clavata]|uniref:OS-9-like protein n=1 Tax=Trichonephila clavata TaxID=2740835 RepID=A0A8X6FX50_TRICU|nr:OS-9-like protein [Trichonephila clavata]
MQKEDTSVFTCVVSKFGVEATSSSSDREIEKLKSSVPPEKFAAVRNSLQKHFDALLNEAEGKVPKITLDDKEVSYKKLTSTLNTLLRKLDNAEKDVVQATKELNKAKTAITETSEEIDNKKKISKDESNEIFESLATEEGLLAHDGTLPKNFEDNDIQVRVRKLSRRPHAVEEDEPSSELELSQRRRLEQAVKEKLERSGLDTQGRKIEVKIITTGYFDQEEGEDFQTLSDEDTSQFQNMIMALLTGQQEAVHEIERQKKLEENYKLNWDNKEGYMKGEEKEED